MNRLVAYLYILIIVIALYISIIEKGYQKNQDAIAVIRRQEEDQMAQLKETREKVQQDEQWWF
jgi:hypothetical protein